ncbi:BamA/TamA family outer membrane protein [Pedobacter mucosus]|uniref:BamA/TamA family outer membrane protein n=1 Tax=Pedobacter mucosus TaxID=2895286 RepID=UPI001EE4180C|nr:BamA/TamA family outer membrane protein [Pedobacter mucosus]UKT65006.1 BamA/TamA family outer membrane protein [Pedobacter mucosus]
MYQNSGRTAKALYGIPIVEYSSETGFMAGLGLRYILPSKTDNRSGFPSVAAARLAYGFKNRQLTAAAEADIYAIKGWQLHGRLSYSVNELSYYFGAATASSRDHKQSYSSNSFLVSGGILRSVFNGFSAGLGYSLQHNSASVFEGLVQPVIEGVKGGWLVGFGPVLRLEGRNSRLFPTRGHLMEATFLSYGVAGLGNYRYNDIELDLRKYLPTDLFVPGGVFALQAIYNGTWGGGVPFYKLPYLTGERALRGIWRNLYSNQQVFSAQGEFRSYFNSYNRKYGYVVFAGMADGAENLFKNYKPDIKLVYGTGLRMQLLPGRGLDLRLDVAFTSKRDVGVYFGTGVSF